MLLLTANGCGASGLFTVPTTGGAARALTSDPRNLGSPTWSPDGSTVAYNVGQFGCHLGEGESVHLETVHADGSGVKQVTDDGDAGQGSFDSGASFSPDGTQIAFSHGTFDSGTIQVVAATGGARTTLLPPSGANVGSTPAWSPDGTRIAYVSGQSIMAVAPGGGTPVAIAANPDPSSCSGRRVVSRRDAARHRVHRGHLRHRARAALERATGDRCQGRREPGVLTRRDADRVRCPATDPARQRNGDHGREHGRLERPRSQCGAVPRERPSQLAARVVVWLARRADER